MQTSTSHRARLLVLLWTVCPTAIARAETGMGLIVDQVAGTAIRVDLVDGVIAYTTPPFGSQVIHARFAPDGGRLVYLTENNQVFVCELDGSVVRSFPVWANEAVSWTPSGIWVGGDTRAVRYDPGTGAELSSWRPVWTDTSRVLKIGTLSHSEDTAAGVRIPEPWAHAVHLEDGNQVADLGSGCSVGPSPDGTLLTHNLWESGVEHQTMKVHHRDGAMTHYFYLFDIIPYPAAETASWSWNDQSYSSNSNDIILIPTGRGFPQMTDSRMPWIYNLQTHEAHCLHTDPGAWDVFWHISDYFTGRVGPHPGQVRIEYFTAAPTTIERGESSTLSWQVTDADQVTLDGAVVAAQGTLTVSPDADTTYLLQAQGDGGPASAQVTVTVVDQPLVNQAPTVAVGPDLTIAMGSPYRIDATASDDGRPDGTLTLLWSQQSGPGTAVFDAASAEDVYVTFDAVGEYVLRLIASDGALSAQDELTATVVEPSVPVLNVLAPVAGAVLQAGAVQIIEWQTQNLTDIIINFSADDRATWVSLSSTIDQSKPEWGHFPWTVPATPTTAAWLWLQGYFGEVPMYVGPLQIVIESPSGTLQHAAHQVALGHGLSCSAGSVAVARIWMLLLLLLLVARRARAGADRGSGNRGDSHRRESRSRPSRRRSKPITRTGLFGRDRLGRRNEN